MKTVKYKGVEIHVGCEGTIVRGVCVRCGQCKTKRKFFGEGPWLQKEPTFDEGEYKQRIRERRDLR